MSYLIRRVLAKPRLILDEMCHLYGKFASYLRRVLCKTRLIFPRINGPILTVTRQRWVTWLRRTIEKLINITTYKSGKELTFQVSRRWEECFSLNSKLLNSWLSQAFGTWVKKWPFMRSEMFKKLYVSRRKISSFSRKIISIYMSCYFGLRDGLGDSNGLYVAPQADDCVWRGMILHYV